MRWWTEAQVRKDKGEECWCWRAGFLGYGGGNLRLDDRYVLWI